MIWERINVTKLRSINLQSLSVHTTQKITQYQSSIDQRKKLRSINLQLLRVHVT